MKLLEMSILKFLDEVDSNSPAPGGGSVSALASALGTSLTRMVVHLTLDKKKYKELEEDKKNSFKNNFDKMGEIRKKLELLVDEDTKAYNLVMSAYKLPKETQDEIKKRREEIQSSLKKAITTPFEICRLSRDALKLIDVILKYGNKNAITDLGVAAILLFSGIEGGFLNVMVNLSSIEDKKFKDLCLNETKEILEEAQKLKKNIMKFVNSYL
ncbi:MAG: cyclodeaminase/cyclohydrolase family protein [Fusobacteriaceae bacterium]